MSSDSKKSPGRHLLELGQHSAEVAHEIRNFLTPIVVNAEFLSAHKSADVRASAKRILSNASLCCALVDHILLGLTDKPAPVTKIKLLKILKDYIATRSEGAGANGTTITLADDKETCEISGNAPQLLSVFENLFRNAEEATTEMPTVIHINHRVSDDGDLIVTVKDHGPGVPPDFQDQLFEEFATRGKAQGTGIGLARCRRIVRQHGGSICYVNSADGGATFEIRLPLTKTTQDHTDSSAKDDRGVAGRLKIICIDDDRSTLDTYRMILSLDHHEVTTAENGKTGLGLIGESNFDVILCDLRLPDMHGREFSELLAKANPDASLSLIFVTGDSMNEDSREFLARAQRPYLIKPFKIEELRAAINVALNSENR